MQKNPIWENSNETFSIDFQTLCTFYSRKWACRSLWLLGIKRKCRSRFFVIFWTVNDISLPFLNYFWGQFYTVKQRKILNFSDTMVLKTWLISWHFFGMNRKCQISEAQLVAQSSKKASKQCNFYYSFHCEIILRLRFFFPPAIEFHNFLTYSNGSMMH